MNYIFQIIEIKNLYWAWEKAKSFYQPGDIWFDELQVSEFEANLHNELLSIQEDIQHQKYTLKPIRPVAFPKSSDKKEGPRTRQTFWISVRDQVTWLAVANILGRELDSEMPFWSYGNRLYISTFYENDPITGKTELNFGYYRNSTRHTYRKWSQSWPLYRRHITLTAKFMAAGGNSQSLLDEDLIDREPEILEVNDKLNDDHPLKVKYIKPDYWDKELSGELYWASLDLKNFYPQLKLNVVKKNIESFVLLDNELNQLLNSIFSFKIDFTGWNTKECEKIKLKEQISYEHMPTGLFFAGFLANVAMLQIDKEIDDKLNKQKNIAHFRYVDDHVILATSFEDLVNWIQEYQEIIELSDIGPEFNKDKTQPEELADYLKLLDEGTSNDEIIEAEEEAKEATKLDPAFPSPLMTQTLAKVSKIAGTEFQLLDPDEERNLIADIEHLLVTEFPDQELRRDTRVSFAARMLSNLVPQVTINTDTVYNLESTLISLSEEKAKLDKNGINSNDIEEQIKKIKKALPGEYQAIDKEEHLLIKRTLKLLLKAIRDNHDKVRLWSRVLEFSLKTGRVKISEILDEVDSLRDSGEVNELSAGFIHALLLQVLSQLLFKALNIYQSDRVSYKQKNKSLSFIKMVITDDVLNYFEGNDIIATKFYEQDSFLLFKYSSGTILFLINNSLEIDNNLIEKYSLINWNKNYDTFFKGTPYSVATWTWWTFNRLSLNNNKDSALILWKKIANKLDLASPLDRNIVQLFPRNLSKPILNRIEKNKSEFIENEGWLFEVRLGLIEQEIVYHNYSFLKEVNSKSDAQLKNNITLYDWINWTRNRNVQLKEKYTNTLIFDPRLSEWMALEIIKKVAIIIDEKISVVSFESLLLDQEDYAISLHPNNFKLPKKWIEEENLTWEQLKSMVDHDHQYITIRAKEDLIYDKRFDFTEGLSEKLYSDNHKNNKAINAIGSLLICLLAKKFELPYRWNPLGHQQAWLGLAKAELRNVALSSYTRDLIDGCFSTRNTETIILRQLEAKKGMSLVNDTASDPPLIFDLTDFIRYVSFIQGLLAKQQLSVSNHQPRQLIPISLKQMKRNTYQEQIEENNELQRFT